jgi:hypothetical protein
MASIDSRPLKRGRFATTPVDFEPLGGEIMGRSTDGSASVFEARWITFFGVVCVVVGEVWNRLIEKDDPELESAAPFHLLWALLFSSNTQLSQCFASLLACKMRGQFGTGANFWSVILGTLFQMW